MRKVFSFDVFDTCLVRKCGSPENFFDILAHRVFNAPVDESTRRTFIVARKDAEITHAGLDEIYKLIEFSHKNLIPKHKLAQIELDLEQEMLVPVWTIRNRINQLRGKGRIIFISDMYLPHSFIQNILEENGIFQKGDVLYVSANEKKLKADASLYKHIAQKEKIKYYNWHHYGDNRISDYKIPRRLGIRATIVQNSYSPFERKWLEGSGRFEYYWQGIFAGYTRALRLSTKPNVHNEFVIDIIAPIYIPFMYRVMRDAYDKGISRLFFCARDAHILFIIAKQMNAIFPGMSVNFFYISQKALYESDPSILIKYFQQIGIATRDEKVAIVDVTSSGKTQYVLNEILENHNYCPVRSYIFLLMNTSFNRYLISDYYCELDAKWLNNNKRSRKLCNWYFYELFFSLHTLDRTIGYQLTTRGTVEPIFERDNNSYDTYVIDHRKEIVDVHNQLIETFTKFFIESEIYKYSDEIFSYLALPQWTNFLNAPIKYYLTPLYSFFVFNRKNQLRPFINHKPFFGLFDICKNEVVWKRGAIAANLPQWLSDRIFCRR